MMLRAILTLILLVVAGCSSGDSEPERPSLASSEQPLADRSKTLGDASVRFDAATAGRAERAPGTEPAEPAGGATKGLTETERRKLVEIIGAGAEPDSIQGSGARRDPGSDLSEVIDTHTRPGPGSGADSAKPPPTPKSVLKFGKLTVDGKTSLTAAIVTRTIRSRYTHGLRRCHQASLKPRHRVSGKVKLKFEITERGKVARLRMSRFNDAVSKCVLALIEKWRFPAPIDADGDPATVAVVLFLDFKLR